MSRLAIAAVSFLGSLGFALAMGYIVLVVRAFSPGGAAATEFLIGKDDARFAWGFLVFMVPYVLLLSHLWLRIRLGDWLLRRGEDALAERYSLKRMKPNPFRARKEALAHRNVVARVLLRRGRYDEAWQLLEEAKTGGASPWLTECRRWQLEIALRRENLLDAHSVIDAAKSVKGRGAQVAAWHACAAEVAIREGRSTDALEALDSARWAEERNPRIALAEGLYAAKFGLDAAEAQKGTAALQRAREWLIDVPGGEGEWRAARARLHILAGDEDAARKALGEPSDAWDRRSRYVWNEVRDELAKDTEGA